MCNLWKNLSHFEKTISAIFVCFVLFSIGYFILNISGTHCPICQKEFYPGESYLWDTRSGDTFPMSDYLNKESDVLWFSPTYHIPQEPSPTIGYCYARFPLQVSASPHYCPAHRTLFDKSEYFLILHVDTPTSLCYAVSDKEAPTPEGYFIKKQLNNYLDCWEIEIHW